MSRKSRQPDAAATGRKGKKGAKGKKGKQTGVTYTEVVEEGGLPFGVVVLVALAMSLPSLMGLIDGTLEFRPVIVRLLAALVVSWLLCQLVYSVMTSATPATTKTEVRIEEEPPPASYDEGPYEQDRAAS